MQWLKVPDVAMYDKADWALMVCKKSGMSLESAQAFAETQDQITFFFFVTSPFYLETHGQFNANEAVFFSGEPWWGGAANFADGYIKPSAKNRYTETDTPIGTGWISSESKIRVPQVKCPAPGVIFAWPGLQPGAGPTYQPIGNGVLQPVLTFGQGPYPNPNHVPAPASWWISGQYVGSKLLGSWVGGDVMVVDAGDELHNLIQYDSGTQIWTQTSTNLSKPETPSVSFALPLVHDGSTPQEQNRANFCLENPRNGSLTQSVSIYDIVLTTDKPYPALGDDIKDEPFVSGVSVSKGNTELSIDRIVVYNPLINRSGRTLV